MCGRFALHRNRNEIIHLPGYDEDVEEWVDEEEFIPRYNIAPRTQAPVIRYRDPGRSPSTNNTSNKHSLILQTMKWGLVPHWSKYEDKSLSTTNARAEGLVEGGTMWDSIKGKQRCAIPVQGYYEWLKKGKEKLPHFTKRQDGELLLLAGLYDCVVLEGRPLWTFTIVTTNANKEFSWLHDRQPVILSSREALEKWLDTSSRTWTPELTELVQPYHDEKVLLECYQVAKEVGKVGTESPTFIEPIATRKDGINAMFSKQKEAKATDSPLNSPVPAGKRKRSPSPSKEQEESKARGSPLKFLVPASKRKRSPSPSPSRQTEVSEIMASPSKKIKSGVKPKDVGESNQSRETTPVRTKDEEKSGMKSPKVSPTKPKPKAKKEVKLPAGTTQITAFFKKA